MHHLFHVIKLTILSISSNIVYARGHILLQEYVHTCIRTCTRYQSTTCKYTHVPYMYKFGCYDKPTRSLRYLRTVCLPSD